MTLTASGVLDELYFGPGNADREAELESYFVRTSVFTDFVKGRTDLVIGSKGSGKSAIFRVLERGKLEVPELSDTDVIGAFNFVGDPRLRLLTDSHEPRPQVARHAWLRYVVATLGNHILATYPEASADSDLEEWLIALDLRVADRRPRALLKRFFERTFVDSSPIVVNVGTSGDVLPDEDLHEVLPEIARVLEKAGRRVWLVFDRLDEAFPDEPAQERAALRALLQVTKDVNDYNSSFSLKLFLRSDIFSFIAGEETTRNLDRMGTRELIWDQKTLSALLCKRLTGCQEFMSYFGFTAEDAAAGARQQALINGLVPKTRPTDLHLWNEFGQRAKALEDTWLWIITYLAEGNAVWANPRNLLNYLDLAIQEQRDALERGQASPEEGSLLSGIALKRAYVRLSRLRLGDVVETEHSGIAEWTKRLHGRQRVFETPEDLAAALGLQLRTAAEQFDRVRDVLVAAGVLRELKRGQRYAIAHLYREALQARS